MSGYLLDTHAWLWAQQRNEQAASATFFSQVEEWQREACVFLSAISVLEVARLVASGRIDLGMTVDHFVDEAIRDGGFQLVALSTRVLIESTRLPGNLHRDPSDRLLAATAREHGLTLVTRDAELLKYGRKGHVRARKL